MKKRRFLALILAATLAAGALTGCSGTKEAAAETSAVTEAADFEEEAVVADETRKTAKASGETYDKIVAALSSSPTDLCPWTIQGNAKTYFIYSIYETLFDLEDGGYHPSIGKSYEVIDDTHWQVEIWDCIYDAEGNHITAEDVVYSYETFVASGQVTKWTFYSSIKAVDEYKVEFEWTAKPDTVYALEGPFGRVPIYARAAYETHDFAVDPVGTGPYKIKEFVTGSKIVLEKNEKYWAAENEEAYSVLTDAHKAYVDEIEYNVITEAAQRVIALETEAIDFAEGIPVDSLATFTEGELAEKYSVNTTMDDLFVAMAPNLGGVSIAGDENFRLAVCYAIDNNAIATACGGLGLKTVGSHKFSDYVDVWDEAENCNTTYDPEKAKEYLGQSAYDGEKIVLLTQTGEYYENVITMIQAYLMQIGVDAEIQVLEKKIIDAGVATDPEGWDFYIKGFGGTSLIGALTTFDYNNSRGSILIGNDEGLTERIQTAYVQETHTDETMTELVEYMAEHALGYGITVMTNYTVFTNDIAEVYYKENYHVLGGSDYYLD